MRRSPRAKPINNKASAQYLTIVETNGALYYFSAFCSTALVQEIMQIFMHFYFLDIVQLQKRNNK